MIRELRWCGGIWARLSWRRSTCQCCIQETCEEENAHRKLMFLDRLGTLPQNERETLTTQNHRVYNHINGFHLFGFNLMIFLTKPTKKYLSVINCSRGGIWAKKSKMKAYHLSGAKPRNWSCAITVSRVLHSWGDLKTSTAGATDTGREPLG